MSQIFQSGFGGNIEWADSACILYAPQISAIEGHGPSLFAEDSFSVRLAGLGFQNFYFRLRIYFIDSRRMEVLDIFCYIIGSYPTENSCQPYKK